VTHRTRGSRARAFRRRSLGDLEAEQESPFLRGQKRVSVRRGSLPKKTANRLLWVGVALVALGNSGRFRLEPLPLRKSTRGAFASIRATRSKSPAPSTSPTPKSWSDGGDIGRNIFFVPLAQRKQQLEQIPWVESASVMRFLPNRLRIEIHERTPVAFARIGSHISLIDAAGMLMELARAASINTRSVIAGMNSGEPLSTRAARMRTQPTGSRTRFERRHIIRRN